MKRWMVTGVIILSQSLLCWSQDSYCVMVTGDTLQGAIRVKDNVITIKSRMGETVLMPDDVVGYMDGRRSEFIYSKPVRYLENTTVYGFLRKELTGTITLYSRVIKYSEQYSFGGRDQYGINSYLNGSKKVEQTEYYLESDKAKIQLATTDVVYDFIRGDREATESVADPKFKVEKHLKELIEEYNGRH